MHRDMRLLTRTLTTYLPYNLVPLGKQIRPRALATTWMEEKNIDSCFVKIFSACSAYPIPDLTHVDQLHFVSQREDILNGSCIHHSSRKNWKSSLPRLGKEIQKDLGGWLYATMRDDLFSVISRKLNSLGNFELVDFDCHASLDGTSEEVRDLVSSGVPIIVGRSDSPWSDRAVAFVQRGWLGGWNVHPRKEFIFDELHL